MLVDGAIARRLLTVHEGRRAHPYNDRTGEQVLLPDGAKVTIGVGRNLSDVGLRPSEIDLLLTNDLEGASAVLERAYPWIAEADPVRALALLDLVFNMGPARLAEGAPTLDLIRRREYRAAAARLRSWAWFQQTGTRAARVVRMLETGELPDVLR